VGWLSGWKYRKSHTINGSTAGAQTNYQIRIKVHRTTGTDSGEDVYVGTKCRADFGDIRFTKSDGVTLLDYWLEEYDGGVATFWVEVDSIPASPGATMIYIYYGKSDATTTSNGFNTFLFFDDFEDGVLDWTTIYGSWSETGGNLVGAYTGVVRSARAKKSFSDVGNFRYKWRAKYVTSVSGEYPWCGLEIKSPSTDYDDYDQGYFLDAYTSTGLSGAANVFVVWKATSGSLTRLASWNTTISDNTFYKWTAIYLNGTMYIYKDDTLLGSITDTTYTTGEVLRFLYGEGFGSAYFDWIFVAKYVDPEPSHGVWGSEELVGKPPMMLMGV